MNAVTIKPLVTATPSTVQPESPVNMVSCTAGNGYYVGGGTACCNITCSNGNNYIFCVDRDGTIWGGRSANLVIADLNNGNTISTLIPMNLSIVVENGTEMDPIKLAFLMQQGNNSSIEIKDEMKIEYEEFTLLVTPGRYFVQDGKLSTLCRTR